MSMQHLFRIIDLYVERTGLSEATVSTRVFNHGARVAQMRAGASPRVSTLDDAFGWFSANWPADLAWPSDIPRPQAGSPVFAHGNGNAAVAAPDAGEAA